MKTNTDATCLHLAVQNGNIELVEYILTELTNNAMKVCINEQAEPFGTPLHIAGKPVFIFMKETSKTLLAVEKENFCLHTNYSFLNQFLSQVYICGLSNHFKLYYQLELSNKSVDTMLSIIL